MDDIFCAGQEKTAGRCGTSAEDFDAAGAKKIAKP
jgi:hypothetical protein